MSFRVGSVEIKVDNSNEMIPKTTNIEVLSKLYERLQHTKERATIESIAKTFTARKEESLSFF